MKKIHLWHVPKDIDLIAICLLVAVFIISPVLAEGNVNTYVSVLTPDQYITSQPSAKGSEQINSIKESASALSVDYSLYVGQYLPMRAWQTTGGPPIPGVTFDFQRSDDGISWCTIQSAVSGPDGYAYLTNYAESCPGIVYYRVVGSSSLIVEWLQTDPPATCVPIPKCVQPIGKTFSITNSMYENQAPTLNSERTIAAVKSRLGSAGWGDPVFSASGPTVTRGFFGGDSQVPSRSINDATLHYHTGHGSFLGDGTPGNTSLVISKPGETGGNFDGDWFNAQDVQNKWGGKNKWVVLHSCNILKDDKWGDVLGTTHGVFGFATVVDMDPDVPDFFFTNAIEGKPLYNSWRDATRDALRDTPAATHYNPDGTLDYTHDTVDVIAAVYFKTPTQKRLDHFPDMGDIAPEGGPDDKAVRYAWNCHTNEDVIL